MLYTRPKLNGTVETPSIRSPSTFAGKPAPNELLIGTWLDGTFTETHVLAITQAICDYRRTKGIYGPLRMGLVKLAWSSGAALAMAPLQGLMISDPAFEWLHGLTKSSNRLGLTETPRKVKKVEVVA